LAIAVYGLRAPEEPTTDQALTVRRAVRGLERRGLVTTRVRVRARPTRDVVGGAVTGGRGAVHRGVKLGRFEVIIVSLAPEGDTCRGCGAPITQAEVGRRRVWCSELCRHRAWNRKRARRAR
jgi:hypothetical protein